MSINKKEKQETFEDWEFIMDDAISDFLNKLPEDISDQLDFSVESLNVLEQYILQNFTAESIEEKENMNWLDGFARYVGQTFVKKLKGAQWSINLEEENTAYYELPLITGAINQVSAYCPHMEVVTALHRKTGVFFRTLLGKAIKRQQNI